MTSTPLHYGTIWEGIADQIPDRPAFRHGERVVAWHEFDQRAARLAGAFAEHGIGLRDAVGLCMFNCPEYFEGFFAGIKLRARPFNVNYRYGGDELRQLLDTAGAKALVYDAGLRDRVAAALAPRETRPLLVEVGDAPGAPLPGAVRYEDLLASSTPAPRIDRPADDTYLNFTGGTTGLPKGVLVQISRSVGNALWFRDLFLGVTTDLDPVAFAVRARNRPEPGLGDPGVARDARFGIHVLLAADPRVRGHGHPDDQPLVRRPRAAPHGHRHRHAGRGDRR